MVNDAERAELLEHHMLAHPFFRDMGSNIAATLLPIARLVEFEPFQRIFDAGEHADTFYLIRTGIVQLKVPMGDKPPRDIQALHEGHALGWSWLFAPYEWEFHAVATTPVRAIAIDAAALRDRFAVDHEFAHAFLFRIAEIMASRLHATRRQLLDALGP